MVSQVCPSDGTRKTCREHRCETASERSLASDRAAEPSGTHTSHETHAADDATGTNDRKLNAVPTERTIIKYAHRQYRFARLGGLTRSQKCLPSDSCFSSSVHHARLFTQTTTCETTVNRHITRCRASRSRYASSKSPTSVATWRRDNGGKANDRESAGTPLTLQ